MMVCIFARKSRHTDADAVSSRGEKQQARNVASNTRGIKYKWLHRWPRRLQDLKIPRASPVDVASVTNDALRLRCHL
jgi:hypothetical protein